MCARSIVRSSCNFGAQKQEAGGGEGEQGRRRSNPHFVGYSSSVVHGTHLGLLRLHGAARTTLGGWARRAGTQAQGETLYRLGSGSKTFFANIPDLIVYYCTHDFFTDSFGAKHKLLAPEGSAEAHTGYLDVR